MLPIIMKAVSMFCGLGGPYVAPILIPIIGLLIPLPPLFSSLWCTLVVSIFIPIYFSSVNVLNSGDNKDKDIKRTFGFSFLIYYIICLSIMCSIMQAACKVSSSIDPTSALMSRQAFMSQIPQFSRFRMSQIPRLR